MFWKLDGPTAFIERAAGQLGTGRSMALLLPERLPNGLREALRAAIRQQGTYSWWDLEVASAGPDADPGAVVWQALHGTPGNYTPGTLARAPEAAGCLFWLEGLPADAWQDWKPFLARYSAATKASEVDVSAVFCVALSGEAALDPLGEDVRLGTAAWRGQMKRMDVLAHVHRSLETTSVPPGVATDLIAAVSSEVASFDAELAVTLTRLPLRELVDPEALCRFLSQHAGPVTTLASATSTREPRWCVGEIDHWNGHDVEHPCWLAANGNTAPLRRRIWRGEVSVLFPAIEERRVHLVSQLRRYLTVPWETEFELVQSVEDLEIGTVWHQIRGTRAPQSSKTVIMHLATMRRALAHLEPVLYSDLLGSGLVAETAA
jgi:hypothetical protein